MTAARDNGKADVSPKIGELSLEEKGFRPKMFRSSGVNKADSRSRNYSAASSSAGR